MEEELKINSTDSATDAPPKTLKDHLLALAGAIAIVGFTLLLIELILRVFDPWGLSYFNDLEYLGNEIFASHDQRGYYMPDGQYKFSYWTSTIQDGGRVAPDSNPNAACEIVILGDSVAHGYGVDDEAVWVNQIAEQLSDVHLINTGVPRYNSTNILNSYESYPDADGYLYLIVQNDTDGGIDPTTQRFTGAASSRPQIVRYVSFAMRGTRSSFIQETSNDSDAPASFEWLRDEPNVIRFLDEIGEMATDERVTFAAFRHETLTHFLLELDEFDLVVLEYPPYRISYTDYHLDAQGNEELADQLLPVFQEIQADRCDGNA